MTVETPASVDLVDRLAAAAVAAIRDVAPSIEEAGSSACLVTFEIELNAKGAVGGATCWLERRVSINKLLGTRG